MNSFQSIKLSDKIKRSGIFLEMIKEGQEQLIQERNNLNDEIFSELKTYAYNCPAEKIAAMEDYASLSPMDKEAVDLSLGVQAFLGDLYLRGTKQAALVKVGADGLIDTFNQVIKIGKVENVISKMASRPEIISELKTLNRDYLVTILGDLI